VAANLSKTSRRCLLIMAVAKHSLFQVFITCLQMFMFECFVALVQRNCMSFSSLRAMRSYSISSRAVRRRSECSQAGGQASGHAPGGRRFHINSAQYLTRELLK
jgi:hypothetical protein